MKYRNSNYSIFNHRPNIFHHRTLVAYSKNCCNFAFACWRQAAKSINIPKMTLKSFLFPLTIIYAILVLPYGFVFAQEEYTCNISVNNIPQVGLKENIFEILGEPDASYVRIFGHWSTVYDDGDSCPDCPVRYDTVDYYNYKSKGLSYYGRGDSLFLSSVQFNKTTYDSCCIQIGDDCLNGKYSMDSFIESCNITYDRIEHWFSGIDPTTGDILQEHYIFNVRDISRKYSCITACFNPTGRLVYIEFHVLYYFPPTIVPHSDKFSIKKQ